MDTFVDRINSPRFQRSLLWLGVVVLAVGAAVFVFTVVGGSDKTPTKPDNGFRATLPTKSIPLKTGNGVTIKTFEQLNPQIRSAIHTFIATVVARKNLDASWSVVAPSLRTGYTRKEWRTASALPVVPYPGVNPDAANYFLDYASTKEILVDVGLVPKAGVKTRPVTFQLGLVPVHGRWLVDYWMPRWTPPVPQG